MIEKIINLSCDGCGETFDETFGHARDLRKDASKHGWINKGSKDYCTCCVSNNKHKTLETFYEI